MPSDTFELIDKWQWISRTEVKPIKVIEINVSDYFHTITFSDEAKEIQKKFKRNYMDNKFFSLCIS